MTFNKTTREISSWIIAIKINEKLKKNNELNKKGKLVSSSKSEANNILREKYGKTLKIKKVFYLNEEDKKRNGFLLKNCWNRIYGLLTK